MTSNDYAASHAAIYHFSHDKTDNPSWMDLRNPVLLSICTLRNFHHELPIYILDTSDTPTDWGSFPERLRFSVIPMQPQLLLKTPLVPHVNQAELKNLSKIFDVQAFCKTLTCDYAAYFDSGIMFLRSLLPFDYPNPDSVHMLTYSSGHYYFPLRSESSERIFNAWKGAILLGILDREFRASVMSSNPGRIFDEQVAMLRFSEYWSRTEDMTAMSSHEHYFGQKDVHQAPKMHNLIVQNFSTSRGAAAFLVKEWHAMIARFLTPDEMRRIFRLPDDKGGVLSYADIAKLVLANHQGLPIWKFSG